MLIRYPGSKAKLRKRITDAIPPGILEPLWVKNPPVYSEPFVGSGAIAWEVLYGFANKKTSIVINDIDPGIACMWRAVRDAKDELVRMVGTFKPTPEAFYEFKASDGMPGLDPVVRGFRKMALHQTSFSGLGAMSGGPLGGRGQKSDYNVFCRWNAPRLCKKIQKWHNLMRSFRRFDVECEDFGTVLNSLPADTFAYLDPPYYVQGEILYKFSMADADHARLAACLRCVPFGWVLSYDDHPRIRELYGGWAHVRSFEMTPTVRKTSREKRRKNRELVICNKPWWSE